MEILETKNPLFFILRSILEYFKNPKAIILSIFLFIFSLLNFLFNENLFLFFQEQKILQNKWLPLLAFFTLIIFSLVYLIIFISLILVSFNSKKSFKEILEESAKYFLKFFLSLILISIISSFILFNIILFLSLIFSVIHFLFYKNKFSIFPIYFLAIIFFIYFSFPLFFPPFYIINSKEKISKSIIKSYYFAFKNKFLIFPSLVLILALFVAFFYLILYLAYPNLKILDDLNKLEPKIFFNLKFDYLVLISFFQNVVFLPISIFFFSNCFKIFLKQEKEESENKIKEKGEKISKIFITLLIFDFLVLISFFFLLKS